MFRFTALAAVVASLACVAPAHAVYVYGFEDAEIQGNTGGVALVPQSTTGVTEGAYSLGIQVNTGWHKALELWNQNYAQTVLDNTTMLIDVTVPTSPDATWVGVDMGFYGDGQGGWQTMAATDGSLFPGATQVTLEFDYVGAGTLNLPAPGATWWNLLLIVNSDLPAGETIYVDNLRFVPEPASLGLLAMGAVALLGRRRG